MWMVVELVWYIPADSMAFFAVGMGRGSAAGVGCIVAVLCWLMFLALIAVELRRSAAGKRMFYE